MPSRNPRTAHAVAKQLLRLPDVPVWIQWAGNLKLRPLQEVVMLGPDPVAGLTEMIIMVGPRLGDGRPMTVREIADSLIR